MVQNIPPTTTAEYDSRWSTLRRGFESRDHAEVHEEFRHFSKVLVHLSRRGKSKTILLMIISSSRLKMLIMTCLGWSFFLENLKVKHRTQPIQNTKARKATYIGGFRDVSGLVHEAG